MRTALVIDDNRQPADCLCQLLSLLEINARPAYSPRAGILALRQEIPDVVFLDINMPGVDGFEVLSYLRREPKLVKVPVIVVTADDQETTARRARQLGATDIIIKPASLDVLTKALEVAKIA
jgi:CheY-like chemotaxis protein